jgi:hypothetical protein
MIGIQVELAQILGPDRSDFGSAQFQTQNFAPTVGIDPDGDDDGDRDDAPTATNLEVGGVDPEASHRGAIGSSPIASARRHRAGG